LLYELLTGQTPFDKEQLKRAGFDEMRRLIREVDPPRPSHRLSTLNAQASSTASQCRGLDERQLRRTLRGELDWIEMKCLEKDRNRRYESASGLARDIERYLGCEPLQASPPVNGLSAEQVGQAQHGTDPDHFGCGSGSDRGRVRRHLAGHRGERGQNLGGQTVGA
jgi:hypothetical protein